jgi:hypothetical protein
VSGDVPEKSLLPGKIERGAPFGFQCCWKRPREVTELIEEAERRLEVTRNAAL